MRCSIDVALAALNRLLHTIYSVYPLARFFSHLRTPSIMFSIKKKKKYSTVTKTTSAYLSNHPDHGLSHTGVITHQRGHGPIGHMFHRRPSFFKLQGSWASGNAQPGQRGILPVGITPACSRRKKPNPLSRLNSPLLVFQKMFCRRWEGAPRTHSPTSSRSALLGQAFSSMYYRALPMKKNHDLGC